MLCGCTRFRLKLRAISSGLESLSTLGELSILEEIRFNQSRAPSLPERLEMSIEDSKSLVTPKREVVIELSVEARFQVL
jgi:hypothetical protein